MIFSKSRPVKIVLVGTGGTGGYIVPQLYRLLYALDRPIRVILCDGDLVEAVSYTHLRGFSPSLLSCAGGANGTTLLVASAVVAAGAGAVTTGAAAAGAVAAVSYTHLDVYKRQPLSRSSVPAVPLCSTKAYPPYQL